MGAGYYISGIGHAGLIVWIMIGGFLDSDHIPDVEAADVSLITEDQFAALLLPEAGVDASVPSPTVSTPAEDTPPEVPQAKTESAAEQTAPDPVAEVEPEVVPEQPSKPEPVETEPAPAVEPVVEPETPDDGVDLTQVAPTPARRVASRPSLGFAGVDTAPAIVRERIPPIEQPEAEVEPEPEVEQAQQEETTTEIVTEAEEQTNPLAPAQTPRPKSRPERVAALEPEPEPEPEPESEPDSDPEPSAEDIAAAEAEAAEAEAAAKAEADARAAAEAEAEADAASTGPPLTSGEKDALRVSVERCWNVGSLSSEALRVTVVVGVTFSIDGRPDTSSINMVSADGGSDAAARQAYEAGRRAIIRCGASGYDLPVEKYAEWRNTEFVFNPEKMRIK